MKRNEKCATTIIGRPTNITDQVEESSFRRVLAGVSWLKRIEIAARSHAVWQQTLENFWNTNIGNWSAVFRWRLVNAPHFDDLTHRIRGADGLLWWSPNQLLTTICAQCWNVSVRVLLCLVFIVAAHLGNKVIVYMLSLLILQVTSNSCKSHRPLQVPPCRKQYRFEK